MHYYSHHISDYMLDTAHLEPMEDLAYRRLLDLYYSTEAAIPLETQWVARRLRLGIEVVEKVLNEFFVMGESGWHQGRCDAEIASYKALADRNKRNGSQGGRPKKTQRVTTGNPVATQSEPTGKPTMNHEPGTKNHITSDKSDGTTAVAQEQKAGGKGTREQLQAYALQIGLPASDGDSMFDHWTANGWKNGREPSRDWQAGMRKWKSQGWMPSQKSIGGYQQKPKHAAYTVESATAGMSGKDIGEF